MSSKKRSVDNSESTTEEPLKRGAAHATKGKGEEGEVEVDEMGEFEDAWEDEIEDDEDAGEVYIEESSDDYESDESEEGEEGEGEGEHGEGANGEGMDLDPSQPTTTKPPKKEKKPKKQVTFDQDDDDQQHQPDLDANTFLPGTHHLEQGEVLVADMSTYVMLHPMGVEWPCLSFDVLRDGLGATRSSVGLENRSKGSEATGENFNSRSTDLPNLWLTFLVSTSSRRQCTWLPDLRLINQRTTESTS